MKVIIKVIIGMIILAGGRGNMFRGRCLLALGSVPGVT